MLRLSYNVDFGYISLFEVIGIVTAYFVNAVMRVGCALCRVKSAQCTAYFVQCTALNKICSHNTDNFK